MLGIREFLSSTFSSQPLSSGWQGRKNYPENSPIKKIAACIPGFGLLICKMESLSLERKIKATPLPSKLRPDPMFGKILPADATSLEIKTNCENVIELESINRHYTKATLVNSLLTIALAVHTLGMNIMPFIASALLIGGFSIVALGLTISLYLGNSLQRYEKVIAANT